MTTAIRIHALRIVAAADCRAAVAGALEQVDWPLAAADEVLILRRIQVGGPLPEIGRLALQQARDIGAHAVSGWEARAEFAAAVRFVDQADLLACLLRDLAAGRMRWFWRTDAAWRDGFALPAGQAMARAMAVEALRWPAVIERLERNGDLAAVWRALCPADAQTLLNAVQQATGWRLNPGRRDPPGAGADLPGFSAAALAGLSPPAWLSALTFPASAADDADDARPRLAVATWLWRAAPHTLARSDAASRVALLARSLFAGVSSDGASEVASGVESSGATRSSPAQSEQTDTASRFPPRRDMDRAERQTPGDTPARRPQSELLVATAAGCAETPAASPTPPPTHAVEAPPVAASVVLPSEVAGEGRGPANGNAASRASDRLAEACSPPTDTPPGAPAIQLLPRIASGDLRCVTRQGGWFLLLNVLALPALRAWREPDNPWIGLYRLGHALGGIADAPLARFLADLAGLADAAALRAFTEQTHTQRLSTQPPMTELRVAARARFGDLLGPAHGAPDFLQLPALAIASASHLDVHYRMADLRLDVRRVALDVNPGWLPWLGRVVNFHYGDAQELMAMDAP